MGTRELRGGHAGSAAHVLGHHGRGGAIMAYKMFQVRVVEGPSPVARFGGDGATAVACLTGAPASPTPTRTALRAARKKTAHRHCSSCGCRSRDSGSVLSGVPSFVDGHRLNCRCATDHRYGRENKRIIVNTAHVGGNDLAITINSLT